MTGAHDEQAGLAERELTEIRLRCDAATGGPWKALIDGRDHESGSDFIMTGTGSSRGEDIELSGGSRADHEFVAHARQDIPRLLDEVARLQRLLSLRE